MPDGAQIMGAIAARDTSALLSSTAGAELTETNLNKFNKTSQAMGEIAISADDPKQKVTDPLAGLTGADLKRAQALQDAIAGDGFDARSYLANIFRNEHKLGTDASTKYKGAPTGTRRRPSAWNGARSSSTTSQPRKFTARRGSGLTRRWASTATLAGWSSTSAGCSAKRRLTEPPVPSPSV